MNAAVKMPPPGFDELSPGEQLEYLFALWGRVLATGDAVPMPDWHRLEIGERLAEYRAGEAGPGREWSEVRRDLADKLAKIR